MKTTLLPGQKRNSNMQEMGETREPMARDCWLDAQQLAERYSKDLQRDFWVLYAAKPHVKYANTIVVGWEVIVQRPHAAMVGVLVFKWSHAEKRLLVESELSLPYDIPLSAEELSKKDADFVPTLSNAAEKSGAIVLA